ncbi:MAG: type I glyceraldehyde-3-phosphate dehydrogenase [Thermoprotei archaeon]
MVIKVGINGFGRIGRNFYRAAMSNKEFKKKFKIVAVNDITDAKTLAYLFKYDSVFGIYPGTVEAKGNSLIIDGNEVKVLAIKEGPTALPWKDLGVELVLESTGLFTKREKAAGHLAAGAKKVIISAPSEDADATIVMGVNHDIYDPNKHTVISMGSCTTNCLDTMVKVLDDAFGVEFGLMSTTHSYTNDQRILDLPHSDLRRARAAAQNIIPTTTGAAKTIGQVIPKLNGKMNGFSLRVPTPDGSITVLVAYLKKDVTVQEVNDAFKKASEGYMKGIVGYATEPIVSHDIVGDPHSSIFDPFGTMVVGGRLVNVIGWYDNEWGFSNRLVDLMLYLYKDVPA